MTFDQIEIIDERSGEVVARFQDRGFDLRDCSIDGLRAQRAVSVRGDLPPVSDLRSAKARLAYALAFQFELSRRKIGECFQDPIFEKFSTSESLRKFFNEERAAMLDSLSLFQEDVRKRLGSVSTFEELAICRQYISEHFSAGIFAVMEGIRPWIQLSKI